MEKELLNSTHANSRGSIIVAVIGLIIALSIAFATFFRFSVNQKFVTKKINRVLLARELSLSLATFASHHLRCEEIHKQTGRLFSELAKPLNTMSPYVSEEITLSAKLQAPLKALLDANSELKNLRYKISWILGKDDFKPGLAAFSREKIGLIRIPVEISYSPPGKAETITENYLYATDVKVIANLVPVLSRFSFFVADALDGDAPDRFNLVSTDKSGNLKNSQYKPWVINNGPSLSGTIPDRFSAAMDSPLGLVYLGGGSLSLANSKAGATVGNFSEGFHLYKEGRGPAMYTVEWLGSTALINWESGLCDDQSDQDSVFWFDLIKEGFEAKAKHNSILKLLGTDKNRSPTIVFGDVYVRTQCTRFFKSSAKAFGALPFAATDQSFELYKTGRDTTKDISFFISQVGNISRSYYNSRYASRLWDIPYNRALGYILSNYKSPDPVSSGQITRADALADFITGDATRKRISHQVPEPYSRIAGAGSNLADMQKFLAAMQVPGIRCAGSIEILPGETLFKALTNNGFLKNGNLDINGWLHIKSSAPLTFSSPVKLLSHAGIVLENGNIEINSEINSDKGFILNLVAADGDIKIASSVKGPLKTGLIANGQVVFTGTSSDPSAKIHGNIAMAGIKKGSLPTAMARGIELEYSENLSALPFTNNESRSEKTMLTISVAWHPYLIE